MAAHDHATVDEQDMEAIGQNGQSPPTGAKSLTPVTPRGEATRQRILEAAEAVFGEVGYHAASVSEITRRAKVAQGTFYIYFHSKREIFAELVEDLGKRLRAATRAASEGARDRLEAERLGFAAFFTFVAQHRQVYHIVQEAERVAPEVARAYYQRFSDGYQRRLREAVQHGDIRPIDPEVIAYALMGIAHFQALRWILWADNESATISPEVADAIFSFIAQGLEPTPERRT
ncbi:MAG TPA: TetR/AcrR family transcriptional regulator [Ktedonobacterales bacterium]|nr:TetR/AcrR family transcriptional regulator [Ktedonobacterales bacterium]